MAETTQQPWTIGRLLDWTEGFFKESDSETPRLEAEVLLAEALGCARIELYTRFEKVPHEEAIARFRAWVKRRVAGEPVAYLVGYQEFYSLRFQVDRRVLIPRPETEHLVVAALEWAKGISDRPIRIIDIGTGSGCVAVTIARWLQECVIGAIDLSSEALDVARINAKEHQVEDAIRFFEGDLFDALPTGSRPVHLIVSNPPYIGTSETGTVEDRVREYEPEIALFAGETGTGVIGRLIAEAGKWLLPGGGLIFETSPIIEETCRTLIDREEDLEWVETIKDYSGHPRIVVARKKADSPVP